MTAIFIGKNGPSRPRVVYGASFRTRRGGSEGPALQGNSIEWRLLREDLRDRLQLRLLAGSRRCVGHDQRHRRDAVVTREADDVGDALLTVLGDRRLERGVR